MENKVGIYYAYWEHDWDADFMPYIARVKELGFDVLEINATAFANLSAAEQEALASEASAKGIELALCVGLPREMDMASEDSRARAKGIAFLSQTATAMKRCRIRRISGILYGTWPALLPEGGEKRTYLDRSVAGMREAAKAAEDNGVTFCLEVVNRFEQFMLNTAAEAVAYIDRVGSPAVKIHLDTFHMNIEEDDPAEAIKTAGGLLGHFHLGENNRRPPGVGLLPWDAIFDALAAIGYPGYLVMEPFITMGGTIGRDIRMNRDLSAGVDLDRAARDALGFVRGHLSRR